MPENEQKLVNESAYPEEKAGGICFEALLLSNIDEQIHDIEQKYPQLPRRLQQYNLTLSSLGYLEAENILKLLDLCEAISPDDVAINMQHILFTLDLTTFRAEKLIALLSWARDRVLAESSQKEWMSAFTDRILALLHDNPKLADELFAIPAEQYPALCQLLQPKSSFDGLTVADFSALFIDKTKEVICSALEDILKEDELRMSFNFWLNNILKLYDPCFDKLQKRSLKEKIDKLPVEYLSIIREMIQWSKKHSKFMEQFLAFAMVFPFSETLNKYLRHLSRIDSSSIYSVMETFNEWVAENPEGLTHVMANLQHIPVLKKLKELDKPLFSTLLSNYGNKLRLEVLEKISAEKELRDNLATLLQIENELDLRLGAIFLQSPKHLSTLRNPLLATMEKNPDFATQISLALSQELHQFVIKQLEVLHLLNVLLTTSSSIVFELFTITTNANHALQKILQAAVNNDKFFSDEIEEKNTTQTLYYLLKKFYNTYKESHPQYISRLLWLIEVDHDKLALKLLKLASQDKVRTHLQKIFELTQAAYLSEVEIILDKLDKTADGVYVQKLLAIASVERASLVSLCLALDPIADKDLYDYVLQSNPAQLTSPKFHKVMVLHRRGEIVLAKKRLAETDTPEIHLETKALPAMDIGSLEKNLCALMKVSDIMDLEEKEFSSEQQLKLALGIATALMTAEGYLNTDGIDAITKTSVYQKLLNTPFFKEYLDRVLNLFKTHSVFNERLQELHDPKPGSYAELMIRRMLNLPSEQAVTSTHAKIITVTTLLTPFRQHDDVGSCFVTSVLMQAASTAGGLLQLLEHYLSLLSHDGISLFPAHPAGEPTFYPLLFNFDEFAESFTGQNLLARSYEYLIANLAVKKQDRTEQLGMIKNIASVLKNTINTVIDEELLSDEQKDYIKNQINDVLTETLNKSCYFTYCGHIKNASHQGAWVLQDRDSLRALNKKNQLFFYTKLFKKTKEALTSQISFMVSDSLQKISTDFIDELFDKRLPAYIHSIKFQIDLRAGLGNLHDKGLAFINPFKYEHLCNTTPYAKFCTGGEGEVVVENYYNKPVIKEKLSTGFKPFQILETLGSHLPERKNEQSAMLLVSTGSHSLNFNLETLKEILCKGAKTVTKELLAAADSLAKTSLIPEMFLALIKDYVTYQDYPTPENRLIHFRMLLKNLSFYETLSDLCQEIVTTDRELMGETRASVENGIGYAIRSLPSLKDKLPVYQIADPNPEKIHRMGLTCSVYSRSIQYVFSSSGDKPLRVNWSPTLWHCSVSHHAGGSDELTCSYFRKNPSAPATARV